MSATPHFSNSSPSRARSARHLLSVFAVLAALLVFVGCGDGGHGHDHDHAHPHDHDHDHDGHDHGHGDHDGGGHVHVAPHGGTLVRLGDEFAHVELVLAADGALTAYVLDGEAEKPIRVTHETLSFSAKIGDDWRSFPLTAQANALSGETVGDSSEFKGTISELAGKKKFAAKVDAITVRGREFKSVEFGFPEGNE